MSGNNVQSKLEKFVVWVMLPVMACSIVILLIELIARILL